MADEDSQRRTDQETSGAFDLSEIFFHRPRMVATPTHMVDSSLQAPQF